MAIVRTAVYNDQATFRGMSRAGNIGPRLLRLVDGKTPGSGRPVYHKGTPNINDQKDIIIAECNDTFS